MSRLSLYPFFLLNISDPKPTAAMIPKKLKRRSLNPKFRKGNGICSSSIKIPNPTAIAMVLSLGKYFFGE